LLMFRLSRDPAVLEPGVGPDAPGEERGRLLPGQFVADVAVKLPVVEVARIPFRGAPHLLRGFDVAREHRNPGRSVDGGEVAVLGPWDGVEHAVRLDDGVADSFPGQDLVV